MIGSDNRILAHAARIQHTIDTGVKPDGSPVGDVGKLDKELGLTASEFIAYQNAQARAHATGKITTEEAQTVFHALGGEAGGSPANGYWAAGTTLALKVTITNLIGELLLGGRR